MAVFVGNIISRHATVGLHYRQTPDTNNRHFENDHDHDCPRLFCLFRESHSPFVPHGDELDESKKGDG
jgi:hypothetical protein